MLKQLRNKSTQKKIYLGLALIIIPAFILSGVFMTGDDEARQPLGFIAGQKVSIQDYLSSYRAVGHQAQFLYGDRFQEVKPYLNFTGEAWDRLLLLAHARRQGIRVTDVEVVEWLMAQPLFSRGGGFDESFYKRYVSQYLNMRERDFEEEIREMLVLSKVRDGIQATVKIDEAELRDAYDRRFGEKALAYGFISWETFKDQAKVDEAAVERLYPIVKDRLTEPEKIRLRFVAVPESKAAGAKAVTGPNTLDAAAKAASVAVQETPAFSKNDPAPAGFPASPELLVAAFSLHETGAETPWVDVDGVSYKAALAGRTAGRTLTLDESKDSIRKLLVRQEASRLGVEKLKALKPRLEKEDFEKVLKEEKIEFRALERYKTGDALPLVGETPQLENVLRGIGEGAVTDPFEGPAGAAIVKVVKERKADEKAYETEKESFREAFAGEKTDERMRELLEKLRKDLKIDTAMMNKIFGGQETSETPAPAPAAR